MCSLDDAVISSNLLNVLSMGISNSNQTLSSKAYLPIPKKRSDTGQILPLYQKGVEAPVLPTKRSMSQIRPRLKSNFGHERLSSKPKPDEPANLKDFTIS